MLKNEHISVTGGTGHLGACIIQMLLNQGKSVKALYRNSGSLFHHKNLTWIQGSISDPASLEKLVENTSIMIHAAGLISLGKENKNEVYKINVEGTESIIKSCLNHTVKMIYISSSTAVQEKPSDQVFNEERPYKTEKDFTYVWTKALAEQKVLEAVQEFNLNAWIIRPTAIVGPPDSKPSYFGQTIIDLYKGKLPAITSGGYNMVDVRDLSQTIINSFEQAKQGEIYLVAGHYLSLHQMIQLINPKRIPIVIPINLLLILLPVIKIYDWFFPLKWPITKESLTTLKNAPKQIDSSKAIQYLNHHIRPISQTLNDFINWHQTTNQNDLNKL